MKKSLIYLILFSFLLQSCYSYRRIDITKKPLVEGKKYKIKQLGKFEKIRLKSQTDSTITVIENKKEIQILKNEIEDIKVKRFSVLKTILLPVGIVVVAAGAIVVAFSSGSGIRINPSVNY
jgi:hypothetical protein